jgi:DNA polymerase
MLKAMGVGVWWHPVGEDEIPSQTLAAEAVKAATPQNPVAVVNQAPATSHGPAAKPAAPAAMQRVSLGALGQLDWQALQDTMVGCQQCDLSQRRRHVVPGMGDAQRPDWLFVGEAPGEEEDLQGQPFVGRSGQLLDRMLAAMGLQRERQVFITNVVKCRPPLNRDPQPQEVQKCSPYLLRQIELLQPRMIVALGRFAGFTLLSQAGFIDSTKNGLPHLGLMRGQVYQSQFGALNIPVVVTYDPRSLLNSPAEKHKAWADLCLAMYTLDAQAP